VWDRLQEILVLDLTGLAGNVNLYSLGAAQHAPCGAVVALYVCFGQFFLDGVGTLASGPAAISHDVLVKE